MVDVGKLQNFLSVKNAKHGDILEVVGEGEIIAKDFSKAKDGSDVKDVLNIEVDYNDTVKTYSPNKTTIGLWREKYGGDTLSWVGKKGRIAIIKQISFGELKDILIVEPV